MNTSNDSVGERSDRKICDSLVDALVILDVEERQLFLQRGDRCLRALVQSVIKNRHLLVFYVPSIIAAGMYREFDWVIYAIRYGKHSFRRTVIVVKLSSVFELCAADVTKCWLWPPLELRLSRDLRH